MNSRGSPHFEKLPIHHFHRFLDEAGDTAFYGKGKVPIVGSEGVSTYFLMGMLTLNEPVSRVRQKVLALQDAITIDRYFHNVPSIQKKRGTTGYYLHAKDDVPEVRKMAFDLIANTDCHFDVVVEKKDYVAFEKKHNGNQAELYADLLSHLLINNIYEHDRLVLNIARLNQCTTHENLEKGLAKATLITRDRYPDNHDICKVTFNIQQPTAEPIINLADYFLWALQRKFERGENRYVDFLGSKIRSVQVLNNNA